MKGPRKEILGVGAVFLLLGAGGVSGLIPLAYLGLDTVRISNVNISVDAQGVTTYTADIKNNWNQTLDVELWSQIQTKDGYIAASPKMITKTLQPYETQRFTNQAGILSPSVDPYTLQLFAWQGPYILSPGFYFDFIVPLTVTVHLWEGPIIGGGSTNPPFGSYQVTGGQPFTVTATPASGFTFSSWLYDPDPQTGLTGISQQNPLTIYPRQNTEINPNWAQETKYKLTLAAQGQGSTAPAPGVYYYSPNSQVTISAQPFEGQKLDFWGVVPSLGQSFQSTENSVTLTMTSDIKATAYFMKAPLDVFKVIVEDPTPQEGGQVSPAPNLYEYAKGTEISIKAFPNSGFAFANFSVNGQVYNQTGYIKVTVDRDLTIKTAFKSLSYYTVSRSVFPINAGSINWQLLTGTSRLRAGGAAGEFEYETGSVMLFEPSEKAGWRFAYWEKDGQEYTQERKIQLTIDHDLDLTAHFNEIPQDDGDGIDETAQPISWLSWVFMGIGSAMIPAAFVFGNKKGQGGRGL